MFVNKKIVSALLNILLIANLGVAQATVVSFPQTTAAVPVVATKPQGTPGVGPNNAANTVNEIVTAQAPVLPDDFLWAESRNTIAIFEEAISPDGTMVRIPLEKSEVDGVNAVIATMSSQFNGVQTFVSSQLGVPMLILIGSDPAAVQNAKKRILFVLGKQNSVPKMLVEISASLKEFTENEAENLGLPLIPTSLTNIGGTATYTPGQTPPVSGNMTATISYPDISLYNNSDVGKVLVGSNVVTGNGMLCNISSTDNTPILISQGGSITTNNQVIQTTVQVTPTIIAYNPNSLVESLVKLDVNVQLSVPTGTVSMEGTTATAFTQKSLTTIRVLPANGMPVMAGSFISDVDQSSRQYIPILGNIPLLGYFFSYNAINRQRQISILMLSVRLIPAEELLTHQQTELTLPK